MSLASIREGDMIPVAMSRLSEELRARRESNGWSRNDVSYAAGPSVSETAIFRAEKGTRPDPWRLAAIARGYQLDLTRVIELYLADLDEDELRGIAAFALAFPLDLVPDGAFPKTSDPDGMSVADQLLASGNAFAQRASASLEREPGSPVRSQRKRGAAKRG